MKHSPIHYTTTPKRENSTHKKQKSVRVVHIVGLSTAVVKVEIKVINASLTQNQCVYNVYCHP